MYNATRTCEPAPVQLDHVQAVGDTGRRVLVSCAAGASGWCRVQLSVVEVEPCPICFEMKEDVERIPHAFPVGDISTHRSCRSCRERWKSASCPFCRGVPLSPPPHGFVGIYCHDAPAHANSEPLNLGTTPASSTVRAALSARSRSLPARMFRLMLSSRTARQRQRSSTASTSCSGCRHGCMECDPCGLLMASDVFENWSWHKLR